VLGPEDYDTLQSRNNLANGLLGVGDYTSARCSEVVVAEAESTGQKAPVVTGVCVGGCLVVIAGLIVGLAAEAFAWTVIANSWSYCFNVPWPVAYDMADSPRFYIFEGIGYLVMYWVCVPDGVLDRPTRLLCSRALLSHRRSVAVCGGLAIDRVRR
jgi:hypothetical protein